MQPAPEFAGDLPLHIALFYRVAFVVALLSLTYSQLELYQSALEIEFQGNESEAPFLGFSIELLDLLFMQEEPAGAVRVVIVEVSEGIGRDVKTL